MVEAFHRIEGSTAKEFLGSHLGWVLEDSKLLELRPSLVDQVPCPCPTVF